MPGTLNETAQWVPAVRYFSDNAVLTGGPDCPDNEPIQDLTDRTAWLRGQTDALLSAPSGIVAHEAASNPHTHYTTWLASGAPIPDQNIGPIWHDDYGSIMTWQSFTANGAAYVGYASVLIGGLVLDTQPTPRVGYVRSGVSNLSRTAYAALRGWAMHHGIMVASGVWSAGTIAVADNPDGATFRAYDVRGEFLRGWDDGRGIDPGRVFGSAQPATSIANYAHSESATAGAVTPISLIMTGHDGTGPVIGLVNAPYYMSAAAVVNGGTPYSGSQYIRSRNVALIACIKY